MAVNYSSPKDILRRELVGLEVVRVKGPCGERGSVAGSVIDETRNMIVVLQGKRRKRIPKAESTFRFRLLGGAVVEVEGRKIVGRPEDRVKRRIMRGW